MRIEADRCCRLVSVPGTNQVEQPGDRDLGKRRLYVHQRVDGDAETAAHVVTCGTRHPASPTSRVTVS